MRLGDEVHAVTFGQAMLQADEPPHPPVRDPDANGVTISTPDAGDGARLWEIARDSQVLDVNSSYAYLLWCHDFAGTSAVARENGRAVGFITGYLRQGAPDTVMIWQVAVDADQRGKRLAGRMLDAIVERLAPTGVRWLQTTVSPDNEASIRLFSGLARDRGTRIERRDLFAAADFPAAEAEEHQPEDLYTIGPFDGGAEQ